MIKTMKYASTSRTWFRRMLLCCMLLGCACSLSSCSAANSMTHIVKQVLKLPYNIVKTVL